MERTERLRPERTAALQADFELSGPISFIFMVLACKDSVAVSAPPLFQHCSPHPLLNIRQQSHHLHHLFSVVGAD